MRARRAYLIPSAHNSVTRTWYAWVRCILGTGCSHPILFFQGANLVSLSVSGLDESELCWIRRLVRALGIGFAKS